MVPKPTDADTYDKPADAGAGDNRGKDFMLDPLPPENLHLNPLYGWVFGWAFGGATMDAPLPLILDWALVQASVLATATWTTIRIILLATRQLVGDKYPALQRMTLRCSWAILYHVATLAVLTPIFTLIVTLIL